LRILKIISLFLFLEVLVFLPHLFIFSINKNMFRSMAFVHLLLLIGVIFFDKFILLIFKIRECLNPSIINIFENHAGRLGVENVSLFVTKKYFANVYTFQGIGGRKNIIVGQKIIDDLSFREQEALIVLALKTISSKRSFFLTVMTALMFFTTAPMLLGVKCFKYPPLKRIRGVGYVFYSVVLLINQMLCRERKDVLRIDRESVAFLEDRSFLSAALYRVAQMLEKKRYNVRQIIVKNFELIEKEDSLTQEIFNVGIKLDERCKNLEAV